MIMPRAGANRDSLSGRNRTIALSRTNNTTIYKRKTFAGPDCRTRISL